MENLSPNYYILAKIQVIEKTRTEGPGYLTMCYHITKIKELRKCLDVMFSV